MVFRQASKHTAWTLSNYPPGKMCLCHCCFCTFGGSTQFRATARQLSCRGLFRTPPLKLGGGGAARPVHPMISKILFCFLMKMLPMLAGDLKTNAPCRLNRPPRSLVCLQPVCLHRRRLTLCLSVPVQEEKGISCELVDLDFLRCSVGFPFMRAQTKVATVEAKTQLCRVILLGVRRLGPWPWL